MGNSESYKEAMRRIEKYGETPARERFAHNVKIGLINKDGTLGPKLRPQTPAPTDSP